MIPRIFHFVFGLREQKEPFHLMYYLCLASCIRVNQPEKVYFHYHYEPYGPWWDLIKPHLLLRHVELEQFVVNHDYTDQSLTPYRYAHISDFARLHILLEYGGVYADIDTLFVKPLPDAIFQYPCVMGEEYSPVTSQGSLCNAWIAAEKDSAFCRIWLQRMPQAFDGTWSNHSTLLPWRLAQEFAHLVHVEPEASFFALDHQSENINRLFVQLVALPEHAYSLHLWNHLWFDAKRRDFSCFHAGLLTVDYVRYAHTTYAQHARKHLPPQAQGSFGTYLWQKLQLLAMQTVQYPFVCLRSIKKKLRTIWHAATH